MNRFRSLGFALLLMLVTVSAFSQSVVPQTMNFQGRLAKPDGTSVPDNVAQPITFNVYPTAAGGTALWSQASNVAVHNGAFAIALDFSTGYLSGNTLATVFGNALFTPYLEMQVGNATPLSPRQLFRSVPYAFNAGTAQSVPNGSIGLNQLANGVLNFSNIGGMISSSQIGNGTITAANLSTTIGGALSNFSGGNYLLSTTPTGNSPYAVTTATIGGILYAFVANSGDSTFQIFNVSNPASPSLVSTTATNTNPHAILVTTIGAIPYAFTANYGSNTVNIYDVSNPVAPNLVKTITTGTNPTSLAIGANGSNTYLYVTNFTQSSLQIFNVTTPAFATITGSVLTGSGSSCVIVSGTNAYVANQTASTVQIVNVATPTTPTISTTITGTTGAISLALYGTTLSVACNGDNTVRMYNVTLPVSYIYTTPVGGKPTYIFANGTNALVACSGSSEVDAIDIRGSYGYNVVYGIVPNLPNASGVALTVSGPNTYWYVADYGANTLSIVNAANFRTNFSGFINVTDSLLVGDTLVVDANNRNRASLDYSLRFGSTSSGEGIASNRNTGVATNVYGIDFYTYFAPRMSISNVGNVGIGRTDPGYPLSFANTLGDKIALYGNGGGTHYGFGIQNNLLQIFTGVNSADIAFGYGSSGSLNETMRIKGTGSVGIGTSSPAYALDVVGDINASGSVRASGIALSSDARYKTNVATLNNALDDVLSLRGVSYDWDKAKWPAKNFTDSRQIGFIAQELEKIFPELVSTDANGYKSVNYIGVVPVLVEAVKTQQKQIDVLNAKVDRLSAVEKENAAIRKQIAELAAALQKMQDAKK